MGRFSNPSVFHPKILNQACQLWDFGLPNEVRKGIDVPEIAPGIK